MQLYASRSDGSPGRLAAGVFFAILTSSFAGAAWGQAPVRTKFDAWELRCETPTGETAEQCALTQTVKAEDAANVSLAVMIAKPKEAKNGVLRVIAPMSVFLLNGVSLKIDQTDIGRSAFFRCAPSGCLADMMIDDKLIEQLKSGKIATVVIYLTPYEGIRHLVMLKGFKEAYEKLP
jgi:invasion protein IalB